MKRMVSLELKKELLMECTSIMAAENSCASNYVLMLFFNNTNSLLSYLMMRKSLYPVIVRSSVSLSLHNMRWLIDRARIYREKTAFVENSRSLSGFIITKQCTYCTSLISMDCDCISWISEVWGSVWDNLPLKCQRLIWVLHLAEKTWRGSSSCVRPWFQYLIWNFRLCSTRDHPHMLA